MIKQLINTVGGTFMHKMGHQKYCTIRKRLTLYLSQLLSNEDKLHNIRATVIFYKKLIQVQDC